MASDGRTQRDVAIALVARELRSDASASFTVDGVYAEAAEHHLPRDEFIATVLGELCEHRAVERAVSLLGEVLVCHTPCKVGGAAKVMRHLALAGRPDEAFELLETCRQHGMVLGVDELKRLSQVFAQRGRADLLKRSLHYLEAVGVDLSHEPRTQELVVNMVDILAQADPRAAGEELVALFSKGKAVDGLVGRAVGSVCRGITFRDGPVDSIEMVKRLEDVGYRVVEATVTELVGNCAHTKEQAAFALLLDTIDDRSWPLSQDLVNRLSMHVARHGNQTENQILKRLAARSDNQLSVDYWQTYVQRRARVGDASAARDAIATMFRTGVNPAAAHFQAVAEAYTGSLEGVRGAFAERVKQWAPGPPPELAGVLILSVLETYAATSQTENLPFVLQKFAGWNVAYDNAHCGYVLAAAAEAGRDHLRNVIQQLVTMQTHIAASSTEAATDDEPTAPRLPTLDERSIEAASLLLARRRRGGDLNMMAAALKPTGLSMQPYYELAKAYRFFDYSRPYLRKRKTGERPEFPENRKGLPSSVDGEIRFLHQQRSAQNTVLKNAFRRLARVCDPVPDELMIVMLNTVSPSKADERWQLITSYYDQRVQKVPGPVRTVWVSRLARAEKFAALRKMVLNTIRGAEAITVEEAENYVRSFGFTHKDIEGPLATLQPKKRVVRPERLLLATFLALNASGDSARALEQIDAFRDVGVPVIPEVWFGYLNAMGDDLDELMNSYMDLRRQQESGEVELDAGHHRLVLRRALAANRFDVAETLHQQIKPEDEIGAWVELSNRLLAAYATTGHLDKAEAMLDLLESRGQLPDIAARRALLFARQASGVGEDRALISPQAVQDLAGPLADFMRDMSHELSNKLEPLGMGFFTLETKFGHLLQDQRLLDALRRNIDGLFELRDRWDTLADPPREAAPTAGTVDLGWVVDSLETMFHRELTEGKVDFSRQVIPPPGQRELLVAMGLQPLDQIFRTLIKNSLQSLKDRPDATLRVTAMHVKALPGRMTPIGGWVQITVRDNGPGVSREMRRNLFQTGVTSKSGSKAGLGRGLAMVRRLLEDFSGDITLRTRSADEATDENLSTFAEFEVLIPAGQFLASDAVSDEGHDDERFDDRDVDEEELDDA